MSFDAYDKLKAQCLELIAEGKLPAQPTVAQKLDFVYGNVKLSNPSVTREHVAHALYKEACVELPWCLDHGMDSHDPACPSLDVARELVTLRVWDFIVPCDHGSHHYCFVCTDVWTSKDRHERCARCGDPLGASKVGDGDGVWETFWHVECAPIGMVKHDGDHHP